MLCFLPKILSSHLPVEIPTEGGSNDWLEPVTDEEYNKLK